MVDLFATKDTAQFPAYYSLLQDDASLGLDAFTGDWGRFSVAYAFPPERLLSRLACKWERTGNGTLLVVAPAKPTAPWFPAIDNLSIRSFMVPPTPKGLFLNKLKEKEYLPTPLRTLRVYVLVSQH